MSEEPRPALHAPAPDTVKPGRLTLACSTPCGDQVPTGGSSEIHGIVWADRWVLLGAHEGNLDKAEPRYLFGPRYPWIAVEGADGWHQVELPDFRGGMELIYQPASHSEVISSAWWDGEFLHVAVYGGPRINPEGAGPFQLVGTYVVYSKTADFVTWDEPEIVALLDGGTEQLAPPRVYGNRDDAWIAWGQAGLLVLARQSMGWEPEVTDIECRSSLGFVAHQATGWMTCHGASGPTHLVRLDATWNATRVNHGNDHSDMCTPGGFAGGAHLVIVRNACQAGHEVWSTDDGVEWTWVGALPQVLNSEVRGVLPDDGFLLFLAEKHAVPGGQETRYALARLGDATESLGQPSGLVDGMVDGWPDVRHGIAGDGSAGLVVLNDGGLRAARLLPQPPTATP